MMQYFRSDFHMRNFLALNALPSKTHAHRFHPPRTFCSQPASQVVLSLNTDCGKVGLDVGNVQT